MDDLVGQTVKVEYFYGSRSTLMYGVVLEVVGHMVKLQVKEIEYHPPASANDNTGLLDYWINTGSMCFVGIWVLR